ncbi:MAG: RdgB/HAM1 family non-canonical purine NTP pyrophosphatase [Pseudomonadota bacterium]
MARQFTEDTLVVASHNAGKVREIVALLARFPLTVRSAAELDLPEPEETGTTFVDNAILKARAGVEVSGLPCLADDSGFCVAALNGAPGVYSARWAGPDKDFARAMRNVEEEIAASGSADRGAWFIAVLALAWPDGHVETFEGRIDGVCIWPPRGDKGFGYDPMFQPEGHTRTFGEMSSDEKHGWAQAEGLSHRARAFDIMVKAAFSGSG